jgi:UDP-GlcNAc:undecaprenyl-phosphate/decaprenyl-phosphate GlcNAc-1-phosphate transferase
LSRAVVHATTFALALALSAWLTPVLREAALRFGIVDRPDGRLKEQRDPVPYLGGLAIFLAFLLAIAFTLRFRDEVLGMLLAGSIAVILGLVDDLGQLGPWTKLLGQAVAVLVLVKSGIYIKLTFVPFWVALPLSVLWLLATTNAFNLIDIMDGLSAGTAAVAAAALFIVAVSNGRHESATLLAGLCGACLGFLRLNFQPARIYMGDAGSLPLGLLLGALAMNNGYTENSRIAAVAPALILGVPLFDMLFVMYVRRRRGLPVMLGSPDHVALRLRKWRLTTRQTVLVSYAATALLGGAAVVMSLVGPAVAAAMLAGIFVAALVVGWLLWRVDMSL